MGAIHPLQPESRLTDGADDFPDEPVPIPIDGTLDLHLFKPSEVKALLREYLPACREKGILNVQIIHGKGTGALRRSVHALLARLPEVDAFGTPDETQGGWGATWVRLRPAT
jgi:DNA-nicking Smr family endonuclease